MTVLNIEKTMDSRHKGDNLIIVPWKMQNKITQRRQMMAGDKKWF